VKFSLKSPSAKLSLLVLLVVFISDIIGRISYLTDAVVSCVGWPVCSPQGLNGWLEVIHRAAILVSAVIVVLYWRQAWKKYRDHTVLLPLATIVLVFFFSNVFIGAIRAGSASTSIMPVLHSLTAVLMWISTFAATVASGYYSGIPIIEFPPVKISQRVRDLFTLTKPIVVSLLLVTTLGGMVAGMKSFPPFGLIVWTLLGGAFAAGGASALNQYIDRDLDKHMQRTANRPLAAGRMFPAEGLAFGLALSIMSFYILAGLVNWMSAVLSVSGIVYYVWLYSILLKKNTVQNIVIGGGAGAIPPLVGWAAATGNLSAAAWFMFAIIFFWTPPHFWALSIVRKKDYERAGVPMLPVVQGDKATRRQIWLYTLLLVAITILMPLLGFSGTIFLTSALILGLWLVGIARKVYKGEGNKIAWKMYRYSSMYLMFIFLALVLDALI
jgi:protoheme IX farnesyltransferase